MATSKLAILESRITTLEEEIAQLKRERITGIPNTLPWWEQRWGLFDNDPDYDMAMKLGRQYRESLRPKPTKSKTRKKAVKRKSAKNSKG